MLFSLLQSAGPTRGASRCFRLLAVSKWVLSTRECDRIPAIRPTVHPPLNAPTVLRFDYRNTNVGWWMILARPFQEEEALSSDK